MFRSVISRALPVARAAATCHAKRHTPVILSCKVHTGPEAVPADDFDEKMMKVFNSPDIDGYTVRAMVQRMQGMDMVPDPEVIKTMMQACRRLNDYALAVRILESIKWKCGNADNIWQYVLQEIKPTLDELGILTPEQMGYSKPELWLENVFDIH